MTLEEEIDQYVDTRTREILRDGRGLTPEEYKRRYLFVSVALTDYVTEKVAHPKRPGQQHIKPQAQKELSK